MLPDNSAVSTQASVVYCCIAVYGSQTATTLSAFRLYQLGSYEQDFSTCHVRVLGTSSVEYICTQRVLSSHVSISMGRTRYTADARLSTRSTTQSLLIGHNSVLTISVGFIF